MHKHILKLTLIIVFLSFVQITKAQRQGNIWYFGQNAGIDFNSGSPVAVTDGQMDTDEGCATICDVNGDLLFYTDGETVWNRLHQIMPNGTGLEGDSSSTQSAIIVPHPGAVNLFYIFTVDNNVGRGGLKYSLIDINLDDGKGNVVFRRKNIPLLSPATEKITAVQHRNGIDVWLIAHSWDSDAFHVFRIGPEGLNRFSRSTAYNIGTSHDGVNRNAHGYMKASPDGSKLAVAIGAKGICEIFDFNNETGEISNSITINGYDYVYGLEFSPDNSKLYVSFRYETDIHQYDISSGIRSTILASRQIIPTDFLIGALQLGVDGKIYATKIHTYLGVINQPDLIGGNVQYNSEGVFLEGRQGTLGLPTFVQSFFKPTLFTFENTCLGDTTFFFPKDTFNINFGTVKWNFGDPSSGFRNTSTDLFAFHQYKTPGAYEVTLEVTLRNGVSKSTSQNIFIQDGRPVVDLGPDTTLCPGTELRLDVTNAGDITYRWNGDTTLISPVFTVNEPGTYTVEVFSDCGIERDTIQVSYFDAGPDLPEARIICDDETFEIDATMPGAITYEWQDGSTDPKILVDHTGNYEVKITTQNGCEIIKNTQFDYLDSLEIFSSTGANVCFGQGTLLVTNIDPDDYPGMSFLWSNGSTLPFIGVTNPDTTTQDRTELFWVVVTAGGCASFASFEITFRAQVPPDPNLPDEITICYGDTLTIDATVDGGIRYDWFELTNDPEDSTEFIIASAFLEVLREGLYCVLISDGVCTTYHVIDVKREDPPQVYVSSPDLCPGEDEVTLYAYYQNNTPDQPTFLWDDGSTERFRVVDSPGTYQLDVTNSCGTTRENVTVEVNTTPPPVSVVSIDTTLCAGQTLTINAAQPNRPRDYFYSWSHGYYGSRASFDKSGTYRLRTSNGCESIYDVIQVNFIEAPIAKFNDEEYFCSNSDTVLLRATNPDATYEWKNDLGHIISTDSVLAVTEPGVYSVKISNLCFSVEYETVVLPIEEAFDFGEDRYLCQSERVTLSVPIQDAFYTWQDGSKNSTLTAQESGIYWVEIRTGSCIITDTVGIYYLSDLEIDLGETRSICNGQNLTLSPIKPTPQSNYKWFDESNTLISTDSVLLVNTPGKYKVEIDNGCVQVSDEVEVIIGNLSLNMDSVRYACEGELVTLDATLPGGSVNYLWNTGATDAMIQVDTAGVYIVQVNQYDCQATDTIEVFFLDLPTVDLGADVVLCPKETLRLSATTSNGTYQWQDGSTDSVFVVTQSGTYTLSVDNGCGIVSDQITVTYKDFPQVELGRDTSLCAGEVFQLDVTQTVTADYLWSNGSTNPAITLTESDTLWVAVTADACTVRDTIIVNFKAPLPSVDLGEDILMCTYDTITLNATSIDPDAQYRWQDGSTDATLQVSTPGIYSVEVFNGCDTVKDTIAINYQEFPKIDFGEDRVLCPEESLLLEATNPESTYLWHDGSTNPTYMITSSEVAWVEVTHKNGCIARDTISITYKPVLNPVSLGNDTTLCPQTTMVLSATSTNPEAQYRWQDGSTDPIYVVSEPGLYSVEVFTSCKTVTDQIQIDYYDLPQVDLGNDALLCPGETLVLDASNPESTYLWHDGSTEPTFTAASTQTVWVAVTHNNGCTVRDTVQVTFKPDPVVDLGPDGDLCEGEELILNASNPYSTYVWQDGSTEPSYTVTQPGTYSVTVDNGCTTATDEVTIGYIPLPVVDLGRDTILCFGQSLLLTVEDQENVTYRWQDESNDLTFRVTKTGKYWVELNRQGCIVTDTIQIIYVECFEDLDIPNVITPNGDGKNDYFVIDNLDLSQWILTIHDRNGNRIYQSTNYQNNWEAKEHPGDVYFYSLTRKGSDLQVKGIITVVR